MIKPLYNIVYFSAAFISATSGLQAQEQSAQEAALLTFAREAASLAGGARFCRMEPEDIEEFMDKADARLVLLARDNYQKVLARLEFKNFLTASSAREPEQGCSALEKSFKEALKQSSER